MEWLLRQLPFYTMLDRVDNLAAHMDRIDGGTWKARPYSSSEQKRIIRNAGQSTWERELMLTVGDAEDNLRNLLPGVHGSQGTDDREVELCECKWCKN